MVQCYSCQQFGHTKSYCKKTFRCVKCGLEHPTANCTKNLTTPPKCEHCLESHTANYSGCNIYQKFLHQKRAANTRIQSNQQMPPNYQEFPQINSSQNNPINNHNERGYTSYAQAVTGNTTNNAENTLMQRLERMMDKLFDMMTQIMLKLCK